MSPTDENAQALGMNWVFGASSSLRNNIINLSDGYTERICYLAAHTAVIFDKRTKKQTFLQGHCNSISCIAVTDDRSRIITADTGRDALLVVWDSRTGAPIRSIPRPHAHGICALDISTDGQWLATVSAVDPDAGEQEIAVWPLADLDSASNPRPAVLTGVPAGDAQVSVRFNTHNPSELISNGRRRVYFWTAQHGVSQRFKYYSPPLRSKDFKQNVGDFVSSVFVPGSTQALTATVDGDVVVWDEQGITAQMGTRATDRRAVKLMKVHNTPITLLSTVGDYIVSGGEDGYVRFFDPLLRIVAWFEDILAGPISGVAFSSVLPDRIMGADGGETLNRFMVPDFVVSTSESHILSVPSASFEEFNASKRKGTLLQDSLVTDAICVVTHPTRAEFAVLGKRGTLQRWDMHTHACLASKTFDKLTPTQVVYSRDGSFMALGFELGYVHLLATDDFRELFATRNIATDISHITCSTTGLHVAVTDRVTHHTLLYCHLPYRHGHMRWEFIGKAKAHHAPIIGLTFGEAPSGQTRLFSLGLDGRVVDYELEKCSPTTGLRVRGHQDFPAASPPTALCFAPPVQYYKHHSADTLLLLADESYKIRVYDPDQQQIVATHLGPTFGGPITSLVMFRSASSESCFLAYATGERVVGLIAWPMDGDPTQTMGLIAHPGAVSSLCISYDGRKLLTSGTDGTLNMWDISTRVLEAAADASAAEGTVRWERVLADPQLLTDMRDYFYYAQIKAQGEDARDPRKITGRVPITMVPDLMRAAGFYPSNAEIADIINHVDFLGTSRDIDAMDDIDFQDFLALYVNHRPLFNVNQEDISAAFTTLGAVQSTGKIGREVLLQLLQTMGEPLPPDELAAAVAALTGYGSLAEALPLSITAGQFSADVLGLEDPSPQEGDD